MTDHYETLGLKVGARQEEVNDAFNTVLAERRAKRQKTSDVHIAHAVLSDEGLAKTYCLAVRGAAAGERLTDAKEAVVGAVVDAIPDVTWSELRQNAVQTTLQATVLVAGFTARASDVTGSLSRQVQATAAKMLS